VHSGEHAWWGGSQSYAESYVTRSVTVPANAAQLKFWSWYDLEDGYDWAFALVSADNGQTWSSLVTTAANAAGTTPLDPIGTAGAVGGNKKYPNGLTGVSGTPPTFSGQVTVAPVMTEHTADFTAYAGKTVLVRFGYSSDAATDLSGFYVDDVRIVDLLGNTLFSDDMEVNAGWTPSGTPGFRWVTKSTTQ
jgi:immune inhibitor A